MRTFSHHKARENFIKTLFKAVESSIRSFSSVQVRIAYILVLLSIALTSAVVWAENATKEEFHVETTNVFPDHISAVGWENVETITFQNVSEYELYQEFNTINSVYLRSLSYNEQQELRTTGESVTQDTNLSKEIDEAPSSSPIEVVDRTDEAPATTSNATLIREQASSTSLAATSSAPEVKTEYPAGMGASSTDDHDSTQNTTEDSTKSTATSELDTETESDSGADSAASTTALNSSDNSIFRFALKQVRRVFDFAVSQSTTSPSRAALTEVDSAESASDESELELAEMADEEMPREVYPETDKQVETTTSTEEVRVVKTDVAGVATSTTDVFDGDEALATSTELNGVMDQEKTSADTSDQENALVTEEKESKEATRFDTEIKGCDQNCSPHTITLSGFGLPLADDVIEISGAQLRLSLAGKKKETRDVTPMLQIRYSLDAGTTWESGGGVRIEDQVSNGFNGGYYLFALPEEIDTELLEQLVVELRYEDDPEHMENLFVESAWLEVFTLMHTEVAPTDLIDTFDSGFESEPLRGDTLILSDGSVISMTNTDENEGETLIIKSDRKTYAGLSETKTYFSVTNTSDSKDTFSLQTYFPSQNGEVVSLREWKQNKPKKTVVPEYRPFVYHCEAGWEYSGEPISGSLFDISRELSSESGTTSSVTDNDEKRLGTTTTDTGTTGSEEQVSDVETNSSEEVNTSASSTLETNMSSQLDTSEINDMSNTATSGTTTLQTLLDRTPFAQASNLQTIADGASSTLGVSDIQPTYRCRNTTMVRACDTLEDGNTACRTENVKVSEKELTRYENGWEEVAVASGTLPKPGLLKRIGEFFGFGPEKKEVPSSFVSKVHTPDEYTIKPGETKYFELEVAFEPFTSGEFWIEAVGDSEYGLLDPFWSSQWQYRMPISIDNTDGGDLTEYQVFLELDNSLTDFWNNVNSDGSDIRFVQETTAGNEEDWYGTGWDQRIPITIQSAQVDENLTDFPVYIDLADLGSSFFNTVQPDGDDIRITESDGITELPYELVSINTGVETGELHFKAGSISSSTDTTFYIYYNNPNVSGYTETDTYGAQNVWSDNYIAVYHLEEDASGRGTSGLYQDSTSNEYDADDQLNSTGKTGRLGAGQEVNAQGDSNEYILLPSDIVNGEGQLTFAYWMNSTETTDQALINGGPGNEYLLFVRNGGTSMTLYPGGSVNMSPNDLSDGNWQHVAVTRDAGANQWEVFFDGQSQGTNSAGLSTLSISSDCLVVGLEQDSSCLNSSDTSQHLNATIDEMRFWNIVPTDGEISAIYRNQSTTTDFYNVGSTDTFTVTTFSELDHWVQYFDADADEADIWVQIDSLTASASSTIYLYYGNSSAVSTSDEEATFSYSTTTDLYYVVDGNSTGAIEVYSLIDGNEVSIDGGTPVSLDEGETTSFTTYSSSSVISAVGPISATINDSQADSVSPIGFATTTHAIPTNRNTSQYFIFAPYASTTVRTYVGGSGTPDETLNIAAGTTAVSNTDAGNNEAVIIEASSPVLVYHQEATRDSIVAYPPTTRDLFGVDSNNTQVTTLTSNPDPEVYCSSGETGTTTGLTRGEEQGENSCTDANDGTGPAMRFTEAVYPITVIQQADGDGSESTAFWPQHEFGTQYYMTTDSAYAAIVCSPRFGTSTIEVQTNSGTTVESASCTPSGEYPGKAYFDNGQGGTNLAFTAGHQIVSTNGVPFYVIYEDDEEQNDETNIMGSVQARKYDGTDKGYSFGAQEINIDAEYEQLSFMWYENTNAETPTTTWTLGGGERVSEGDAIEGQGAVNIGEVLRLRMNLQANVATGTASSSAFALEYAEANTCTTATNWQEIGDVGSTTAAFSGYNNTSVDDGQTLSSTTLSASTIFATYEEESLSEFIPNQVPPGDVAEWDWVITNSNAEVNTEYCFRMVRASGDALETYTNYPQLVTSGPPDAATLIKRFNNEHATSVRPTLEFVASDLSGNDLHYQVQIDDDADFSSTILDQNSQANFSQFENVPNPSDKSPFNSGQTIRYTPPSDLATSTYWWRVRSKDPDGSNTYSEWSTPYSFTINEFLTVSEWYQTTDEQFETNSLISMTTSGSGSVELDIAGNSNIGEYGSVTVTNGATTTVNLNYSYTNPVVTASVEYSRTVPNGDQPAVRVFNKTGTSFDVLSDNFTYDAPGTSTVHYIVMEAGEYLMDDGDEGLRVYATSTSVSGYIGDPITGDPGLDITFPTSFGNAPSVLTMVTTNNDQDWVLSSVYDGTSVSNPPTASQMGVYLNDNIASDGHSSAEDVDIIAFDSGVGTNNGVPFDIFNTGIDAGGAYVDDTADTFTFTQTFSSVPGVTAVQQLTMNGSQGSYAMVDIDTPVTTTGIDIAVDEGGTNGSRGHADEDVTVVVFENATGTIIRAGNGQVTSSPIDFDDADVGNAWGEVSFTDSGDVSYHIEYNTGSGFEDIPDSALSGNSSGFTTSPINILSLDTDIYNKIRLVADFSGVDPELYDWTVSWGQRVEIPTLGDPFDNEQIATTTPTFDFVSTDPQDDDLEYEISWSTDQTFTSSTTRNSSSSSDFSAGNPYTSGDTVTFTIPPGDALTDTETYWWRVRAKDPNGGNAWSPWSNPDSFTVDTSTLVSTWFQTTQEQFAEGELDGTIASTSDSLIIPPSIGVYGTTTLNDSDWQTITTDISFNEMVVVAKPSYDFDTTSENSRVVRVRNKTSNSFQIRAETESMPFSGTTSVDYIAIERGDWVLGNGGSGIRVIADTAESVSALKGSSPGYNNGQLVEFDPAFTGGDPGAILTISSDNSSKWVAASMDDGSGETISPNNNINASGMYVGLEISVDSTVSRTAEDIDYIAFETGSGTNGGVLFDLLNSSDTVAGTSNPTGVNYNQSFTAVPGVVLAQINGMDGGQGGTVIQETGVASTNSTGQFMVVEIPSDNGHTAEDISIMAFEAESGEIVRGDLGGTIGSEPILFSDGAGPKFERALFSNTSPGNSSTSVQVQYQTATGTWALIPDSQIPGNSTGTTTSPIDLTNVDIVTYPTIRLFATLLCDGTDCPTVDDWTVEWSEGVPVTGTIKEYDRTTDVTSGTVRVAVNGTPGSTGTINGDGTWRINNVTAFEGDVVTVWVDGAAESDEAVSVFVYDGVGDMTGVALFEQHLSLSSNEQATTTTALLSRSDYSVIGDEDVFFDVDYFGNLSVCAISGCDVASLYVGSGNVFVPATSTTNNIFTHDFINDGVVELDSNNLYVSGSWVDAGNVSPDTSHVIFTGSEGGWYDDAWQSRLPITIASAEVDAPLNDFPVYVDLSDLPTSFFSDVKADGGDIRITQSDGITEVPFELVSIDTGAQKGQLHFKAPRLSDTIDSTFYLYFDNPSASGYAVTDTYGRNNVWSDYEAVWHLNDTNFTDSTGDPRTPTNTGVTATTINGRDAMYFDGNSYLNFGNEVSMGLDDLSISVYVETTDPSASYVAKSFYSGEDERYALIYYSGNLTSLFDGGSGNANNNYSGTFRDGAFRQAAVTYDRDGNNTLYSDGVPRLTKSIAAYSAVNFDKTNNLYVGAYNNPAGTGVQSALNFTGKMVELKMSRNVLSSEWLAAEYSNQTDASNFYSVGTTSSLSSSGSPTNEYLSGALNFNTLSFNDAIGGTVWETLDDVTVNDDLNVTLGTLNRATSAIDVAKNITTGMYGFWSGVGTTTFSGTGVSTWTDNNATKQNVGHVRIDGSAKTITLGSSVYASDVTIGDNDTLNAGGAHTLSLAGNFTNHNIFSAQTGTIAIVGTGTNAIITTGGSSLYSFTASTTDSGSVSFAESNVTMLGDFTIATGTVTMPTATTSISGSFSNTGGTFAHNNAEVRFIGSGSETIQLMGTQFLNHFYDVSFTGGGDWTFLDTNATTSNTFTISDGNVVLPSGQLSVARNFSTLGSGSFDHNGGEVLLLIEGNDAVSANGSSFNDIRVRTGSAGSGAWYNENWLYRLPVTIRSSEVDDDLTDFPVYVDLADLPSAFFSNINSDGGDIRITESDGTTEVPREIVSASTTAATGELYFEASSVSSTTDTIFYLYYGNSGASDYAVTDTYGAENVWSNGFVLVSHLNDETTNSVINSANGSLDGSKLSANNPSETGLGHIYEGQDFAGTEHIGYGNVGAGASNITISAWFNADNLTGSSDTDTYGYTIFSAHSSGNYTWLTVGGTGNGGSTDEVRFCAFSSSAACNVANGSNIGTDEWHYVSATAVDGGAADVRVDGSNVLSFTSNGGGEWDSGSTIGDLRPNRDIEFEGIIDEVQVSNVVRSTAWQDATYRNQATTTDFYAVGSPQQGSVRTFSETNVTALGNIVIESGQTVFPTGSFFIGGSFDNDDEFDANGGTVVFNSTTSAETIAPGGSSFYNLIFDGAGGDWTITENATATNAVTLTDADTFTVNSGITLESTGSFSNSLANASTTWTGATVRLSGGTDFALNSKNNEGDDYNILSVTGDGDVSMWNSTAATYDTQDTASIYSQDHAGTDGDLYIFGEYVRENNTEYWSYETDFDGADLVASSSERQVNVRVASGASVTASSSVLKIVGSSTASTTIDAQSGSFTLLAQTATVTAEYFELTGTDANGFQLMGSSTVTMLDNGVFTISTADAITVDASTVDTNPAAQFFHTDFITAGGNVNVDLSGTPNSFWWFRDGAGDRYGEAFDNNDDNPGQIRWDDSSYQINVTGTVYADDGGSTLGGPTCDGVTQNVRLVVDGGAYTDATSCDGGTGEYTFTNISYQGDATIVVYLDTDGGVEGSVITRTPTGDISDLDIYANRVLIRHEDSTPMDIAHIALYDENDDSDLRFSAATGTTNTLTVRPDTELYVWASSTFTPGGTVTLESGGTGNVFDGSLHLGASSTFTGAGTTTYSVGGSIILEPSAELITASSTFDMTATTSGRTITASSTINFNKLTFTGVGGAWNLNTDITSAADIEVATGTLTGTENITLTNGSFYGDGIVSLGGGTTLIETSNTLGGAQGWTFNDLTLGNGGAAGTTTPGSNATTTVAGTLTIRSAHTLDAGGSVWNLTGSGDVFQENGIFSEDTSTVRYGGTSGNNILNTNYYNLIVDADGSAPIFTADAVGIQILNDLTIGITGTTTFTLATNDPVVAVGDDVLIATYGTLIGSDSALLTVSGSWDNDGIFTSSNGTVDFDSADAFSIAAGASSFGAVTITGTGAATITENATSTGAWTFASTSDVTVSPGQRLAVGGDFNNNAAGAATTWIGATLHLFGAGQFEINASTTQDEYATLSAAAGTHIRMWNSSSSVYTTAAGGSIYSMDHENVSGDLYIFGDYEQGSDSDYWSYATDFDGTNLFGGSERTVNVYVESGGSITISGGSLEVIGTSSASTTIQNQGSGTYSMDISGGTFSAQRYVVQDMDNDGLTFTGTPTVTTLSDGEFIIGSNAANGMTIAGSVIDQNPAKNFVNNRFATTSGVTSAFNASTTGSTVSSWRFTTHYGDVDGETFDLDGGGDPGYVVWDDSLAVITISGTIYENDESSVSSVCDDTTNNIVLAVDGVVTPSASSSCSSIDGSYSISGISFSPNDTLTLFIDGETDTGATVSIDPISSVGNMDIYEDHVIVRHESSDPILIADMADYDSSDDGDIPFTAVTGGVDTLTLDANVKLIIWDNKEFTPGGNITTGGGIGDALDGTVELRDDATLTFANGETHSIGGNLEAGTDAVFTPAESNVTFTSSGAGRTIDTNESGFYDLTLNGTGSFTSSDIALSIRDDLTLTNGSLTLPAATTTISGSLTTTGGSFDSNSGRMVFDSSGAETVTAAGSSFAELRFIGTGTWSMNDTNATATGAVIIESGAVTLPSGTLAVAGDFSNQGGSFSHNTSELRMSTTSSATLRAGGSDLYRVTFADGVFTMADTSLSLLDDLSITNATATLATGTLSIAGSFNAGGGSFDSATGTILFNSSDTGEIIDPGVSSFYNVNFGSGSGGWTITSNATATNNFTLSNASSFTQQSGTRLYIGNVFTNAVGGGATQWSGSTLVLDSGLPYSVNSKSTGGDMYNTLEIGANTDIRIWNSEATTIVVEDSASLYSQNHAASSGSLNIYGDFHVATGTEYWSYATDFDGTVLGGSSRAVTVQIADGATTTIDGGSVQIIGDAGASTTINAQGSGTYSFEVNDGVFNAEYYVFNDLDINGLIFNGAPSVTSLNNGEFILALDSGSLITLSSTTLSANPSKFIDNVRFATTTAISGRNIDLNATTSTAWTFRDHYGNLSGERFDSDGLISQDCGSIRWDDSSCLLIEQTHYRWRNDDGGLGVADTEWFDTDWDARKRVRVVNNDNTTYATTAVKMTVTYDGDMQSDFEDLRFTKNDGITEIPYWIERYTASANAVVWIQVPSLPASGTYDAFMYYNNLTATSTSSSTPVFIASDDFEDNNVSEYEGDTTKFQTAAASAYGGSYGLEPVTDTDFTNSGISRFDLTSSSQGHIIRYMQYVDTAGSSDESCTLFGVQDPITNNENYGVCIELFGTDRLSLVRDAERSDNYGSVTQLASTTVSYSTGWYEIEIDWQTDDTIDVTLFDDSGSIVATTSATDSTYTEGAFGFTYWGQTGGWDDIVVRSRTERTPSVLFGGEQSDGGASWNAPLDSASLNFEFGDVARLRFSIENTGLDITGETYQLEAAPKGASPSCESVSAESFSAVAPQSSCGSDPICMATSSHFADGDAIADLLTETSGTFTMGEATEDPSNTADALDINQNEYTELEYALTATVNATDDAYCLRVTDAGDELDAYSAVAEFALAFAPSFGPVSFNLGQNISLVGGTTTRIYATSSVTDLNGYTDLSSGTTTMYTTSATAACSPDDNNCYIAAGAPQCTFTDCSGNSCTLSCYADFQYHATPTASDGGEYWYAFMEAEDTGGNADFATSPGIDLYEVRSAQTADSIEYGSLAVNQDTGSTNASTSVENIGNVPIDIEVDGTDLSDGGSSLIPATQQLFSSTTFTYSACTNCVAVPTSTPLRVELDLMKPTSTVTTIEDDIYWGIAIPFGVASNPHTGENNFTPVDD